MDDEERNSDPKEDLTDGCGVLDEPLIGLTDEEARNHVPRSPHRGADEIRASKDRRVDPGGSRDSGHERAHDGNEAGDEDGECPPVDDGRPGSGDAVSAAQQPHLEQARADGPPDAEPDEVPDRSRDDGNGDHDPERDVVLGREHATEDQGRLARDEKRDDQRGFTEAEPADEGVRPEAVEVQDVRHDRTHGVARFTP